MNTREGMRRVGIVLGALGCVAGGAFGYWNLMNVWNSHTRFERLQALPVMLDVNAAIKDYQAKQHGPVAFSSIGGKQEIYITPDKIVEVPGVGNVSFPGGMSDDKIAEAIKSYLAQHKTQQFTIKPPVPPLPPGYTLEKPAVPPPPPGYTLDAPAQPAIPPRAIPPIPPGYRLETPTQPPPIPPGYTLETPPVLIIPDYPAQAANVYDKAVADDPAAEITVDVKGTDGIQTVNADKGGAISSIQLTTGEWARRGAKTLKARLAFIASLLLPFCYPVVGFLVPWGTLRVFVWVAGGFSAPQSSS